MNDEIETLPPLYAAVLETSSRLRKQHPDGTSIDVLGVTAWNSLTAAERSEELPHVLGAYVCRVYSEENAKVMERRAADPTHTYLGDHDMATLWDSALDKTNEFQEVPANQEALINVLCELELLQHRLAMRTTEGGV